MIDSILQRHTDPIIFNNITYPDSIIDDPKEIKTEIRKHFEEWTKHNPINDKHWAEWQEHYKPQQRIDEHWYNTISNPITIEELQTTIR